jgi:lamin tail-like protein
MPCAEPVGRAAWRGRGGPSGWVRLCLVVPGLGVPLLSGIWACGSSASPVVISEFVASNTSGLRDVDGETSDWIELHNSGSSSVDLEGWCLTDDPRERERWCFPGISVPAQGYVVVFASGKRAAAPGAQLHASFKLKATEDYLALVRPGGAIAQAYAPYPDQKENVAFGLTAQGTQDYLGVPTPGAPNR